MDVLLQCQYPDLTCSDDVENCHSESSGTDSDDVNCESDDEGIYMYVYTIATYCNTVHELLDAA